MEETMVWREMQITMMSPPLHPSSFSPSLSPSLPPSLLPPPPPLPPSPPHIGGLALSIPAVTSIVRHLIVHVLPEPQLPTVHPRPEEEEEDAANVVAQSLVGDQTLREGGREGRGGEGRGGRGGDGGRERREGGRNNGCASVELYGPHVLHMIITLSVTLTGHMLIT